jgi:hypothetical protein
MWNKWVEFSSAVNLLVTQIFTSENGLTGIFRPSDDVAQVLRELLIRQVRPDINDDVVLQRLRGSCAQPVHLRREILDFSYKHSKALFFWHQ